VKCPPQLTGPPAAPISCPPKAAGAVVSHMRAELVLDALEMANGLRWPDAGLIAHNDRGSQYTSFTYTDRLDELRIDPSVGSNGDAYDPSGSAPKPRSRSCAALHRSRPTPARPTATACPAAATAKPTPPSTGPSSSAMRFHQPTIDYVARRSSEGRTKRDIIRCLKRFLAREIYHHVMNDRTTLAAST
jgi:hypothetical protein